MSAPVELSVADGIAALRFVRPERLNALDVPTAEAFRDAVAAALDDPAARVLLVSSEGRAFMAGGDLAAMRDPRTRGEVVPRIIGPIHDALKQLEAGDLPVVCAAQGAVAGAGLSILAGADLAVASEDARFSTAYVGIGATPDCGGTWALPRLVGVRRALELFLLGEPVDASEALRIGLVNRVVPPGALASEAQAIAARLAAGPPLAQGRIRRLVRAALDRPLADQLDAEEESFRASAATADFTEGLEAFFARRPPRFEGR